MRTRATAALVLAIAAATSAAFERDAEACGGCFVPPENNTVVTDHRMILSVSQDKTTLYDQIRYQGSPESFAWVLPITGEATIGLSADVVFGALDQFSQTQVIAPPTRCPPPPDCGARGANAGAPTASEGDNGGVVVNKRETVGPYETVQLSATNPQALDTWLATNGFTVPADVKPVVAKYVTEHFDFLALKLVPGASVTSMRPVRVTTRGAAAVLPLRMVAAGTGPVVGITLWVVADGIYETQNFPSFRITDQELVWDWATQSSNYKALRAKKTAESNGRGWEVESAQVVYKQQLESMIRSGGGGGPSGGGDATEDYLPIAQNGTVVKTAAQVRDEDLQTLFATANAQPLLTRLRADLDHAALTEDLVLTASQTQTPLSRQRRPQGEANQPQCPVFQGCNQVGNKPRDEAIAIAEEEKTKQLPSQSLCSTAALSADGAGNGLTLAFGLGLAGAVVVGARRRRRGA